MSTLETLQSTMVQKNVSLASSLALLPASQLTKAVRSLTEADAAALLYDWNFWARPNQLAPPGAWRTWLVLAGRGFGKSRTGAEWIRDQVENHGKRRIALLAPTAGDARDVMVEGESGLLSIYPHHQKPLYEPSKRRITFRSGAIATTYSADEPERLRGPQHDAAWFDEAAAANYPDAAWDMLMFGLRLGQNPRVAVTTTPKPIPLIRALLKAESTVVTRGTTYENRANLAPEFFSDIISKYEGTRLGRQELLAEVLEDFEGALWSRAMLDATRIQSIRPRDLQRVVVAIDPAVSNHEDSDETGIVVAAKGVDGRGYVLADYTARMSPDSWARRAIGCYEEFHADRIVAEVNNGGDLVERCLRTIDSRVSYKAVHASKGKITRAEPVAALFEQGKISMVGSFPKLEDELCTFTGLPGEKSPNRLDAMCYSLTELFIENTQKLWVVGV